MIGNKIKASAFYSVYGMYMPYYKNSSSYGATGPMFIANNEIILESTNDYVYGIYVYSVVRM